MVDDVVAVDRGIEDWVLLQGVHRRLDEEGHEAELDTMLLLELVFVLIAQVHHRRHIHLVERGEDGIGRLRLHQAFGDAGDDVRCSRASGGREETETQRLGKASPR